MNKKDITSAYAQARYVLLCEQVDDLLKNSLRRENCSSSEDGAARKGCSSPKEKNVTDIVEFVFRVNGRFEFLRELIASYHARSAVFMTACNPSSVILSEQKNYLRTVELGDEIRSRNYCFLSGYSTDDQQHWPREESFLIFDVSIAAAFEIANQFDQLAFLVIDEDGFVKLQFV
ncbi:DUF3293 domain-containing protein [Aliikangiella marina]|uniref:DUF3293 domain-containing protein n=1 Tax=Aliikangiella marina TaxID=1712262 RepID=A0A545T6Z8_9GAMM|nr:DUF3293 domain-containing protein [Aliikangiella marina]TQV72999.1 DUF3293 domain-containing protein [Aliikangiella marina]